MTGEEAPRRELLIEIARDRAIELTAAEIDAAHAMLVRFRHEIERLRRVPLEYAPPYVEPATALAWIRNGGRSA